MVNHHETAIWEILCIHPPYWTPEKKISRLRQGIFDVGKKKMPCDESPKLKLADEIPHCGECSKFHPFPETTFVFHVVLFFCFPKGSFFRRFCCFQEFLKVSNQSIGCPVAILKGFFRCFFRLRNYSQKRTLREPSTDVIPGSHLHGWFFLISHAQREWGEFDYINKWKKHCRKVTI